MGLTHSPHFVTDGLIAYWDAANSKSYPGSGTSLYDLSGNNITGTLQNEGMATAEPGTLRLNNTTDRIQFGHTLILEPANLTINAWVNLLHRGDRHILITKWLGWSFEIHADKRPYLRLNGSGTGDQFSTIPLVWGQWHMITGTFDDDNNIRHIYIDSVEGNETVSTGTISYNQGNFNLPYQGTAAYGKGKIGPVSIYNKALSSAEVSQNYNAFRGRYGL